MSKLRFKISMSLDGFVAGKLGHVGSSLPSFTHLVDRPGVRGTMLRRVRVHVFVRQELLQLGRFMMDRL